MNINEANQFISALEGLPKEGFVKRTTDGFQKTMDPAEQMREKEIAGAARQCLGLLRDESDLKVRDQNLNRLATVLENYGRHTKFSDYFQSVIADARSSLKPSPPAFGMIEALTGNLFALVGEHLEFPTSVNELEQLTKAVNDLVDTPEAQVLVWKQIAQQELDTEPEKRALHACKTVDEIIARVKEHVHDFENDALVQILPDLEGHEQVSKDIAELPHAEKAAAIDKWIRSLPNGHQTKLYVQDKRIRCIPPAIFTMKGLTSITFEATSIRRIPPEIAELTALTQLCIIDSKLRQVPDEIRHLPLKFLILRSNDLQMLPEAVNALNSLTSVDVSDNQLKQFPDMILSLPNVNMLRLNNNQIPDFPIALVDWRKGKDVNLEKNPCWHEDQLVNIKDNGRAVFVAKPAEVDAKAKAEESQAKTSDKEPDKFVSRVKPISE